MVASNDHNSVFDNVGQTLEKIQTSLNDLGNLLIIEASSYFEIIRFLHQRHIDGFRPPSIIHITAHGST